MDKAPLSLRTHITIFGNTNSGKSSLFNKLIGEDMMIVSDIAGTTTDPVTKAMELIGYGAVALTDTAGWGDITEMGGMRKDKTDKLLTRTDFAIYTADINDFDASAYIEASQRFVKYKIPHMLVFTKCDNDEINTDYTDAIYVSVNDDKSIENLVKELISRLRKTVTTEPSLLCGILGEGNTAVLVIPIDSEAPKGRLILPQVQLIRECLDNGVRAVCVRDSELKQILCDLPKVDLVVTDSQIFKKVNEIVPRDIKLTSFSMLLANAKGDIHEFARGAKALDKLKDGSKILMAEACTHNTSHEDIGRVKIPDGLRKYTGKDLVFDYCVHNDFPENLDEYDLVIHCGGCMLNRKAIKSRILQCRDKNVSITNYGVVLAYISGILDRSIEIYKK